MNGLDLFLGIGGISLALREWVRPVAYCEIDRYCQGVLLSRMLEREIYRAPIWDDIRTFPFRDLVEPMHIIYGGFPCQDISIAGVGRGLEGERSGLFYEIVRLCSELKPRFIFLENVPAITTRGGTEVVREITALGYDCRWCIISAASVGALHRRERWFLLAHAKHNGTSASERGRSIGERTAQGQGSQEQAESERQTERTSCLSSDVADSNRKGCDKEQRWKQVGLRKEYSQSACGSKHQTEHFWSIEPDVGRVADGVQFRVDRLKGLGNSVVPQQTKEAFKILMGLK